MRARLVCLAILAIPAYLLIDLAIASQRGWWPTSRTHHVVVGICVGAITVGLLLAAMPRPRAFLAARSRSLLLALLSTAVAWCAIELLAGAWLGSTDQFHRSPPGYRHRFEPHPAVMRGISGPSTFTANSAGLRGPELPPRHEAYRLLCVGGSTTACIYLDDAETWTRLLMDRLDGGRVDQRVWVGGAGLNGASTREHVRLLEDRQLLQAMDGVVFLLGVNDFIRSLLALSTRSSFGVHPLFERSNVYRIARRATEARRARREGANIESDDGSSYVVRRQARAAAAKRADLPDLSVGLADYERNLGVMIAACRRCGVRPVFASQPVLWSADLSAADEQTLWLGALPDSRYLEAAALAQGMRAFNDTLLRVCAAAGVECVDLSSMSGRSSFFYDDCHFTEAGAREVARLLATALSSRR